MLPSWPVSDIRDFQIVQGAEPTVEVKISAKLAASDGHIAAAYFRRQSALEVPV
jgi:hypothetical protein